MSAETTRAAVTQLCSGPDLEANLEATARVVRGARSAGAALIVVPECFSLLGPEKAKLAIAEDPRADGRVATFCRELARSTGATIVFGGFWEKGADAAHVYNTSVVVDPRGEVVATYRKIHLFDVDIEGGPSVQESRTMKPGDALVTVPQPFGSLGLSICYDVRFPALYRGLVERGAVALTVPAAFTKTTGEAHWHLLLRARAVESQAYVLAANQTGTHFGNRQSFGHSLIVDPWGRILDDIDEGEGYAIADIDPSVVAKVRRELPSLAHRRL